MAIYIMELPRSVTELWQYYSSWMETDSTSESSPLGSEGKLGSWAEGLDYFCASCFSSALIKQSSFL